MARIRRAAAVVLLAFGLTGVTVAAQAKPSPPPPPRAFTVSGDVSGLYPGSRLTLRLTVRNTLNDTVYVHQILVESISVDRRGCPAGSVWSPGFVGTLRLPKRATVTVSVPVAMKSSAPTACQGAIFNLRYTGWGERS